jgi:hypothetical protein
LNESADICRFAERRMADTDVNNIMEFITSDALLYNSVKNY